MSNLNITIQSDLFQTIQKTVELNDDLIKDYYGLEINRAGYKAELLFDVACIDRGIETYAPQIQSSKVDRVTIAGTCVYRVQIKHPGINEKGNPRLFLTNRRANERRLKPDMDVGFDSSKCDIVAALPKGSENWYIIPSGILEGRECQHLGDEFNVYKGAWRLLSSPMEQWQSISLYAQ
jgi:hypothetical protein